MEFKGTKGNWEVITCDYDLNKSVFLENTEQEICTISSKAHNQMYDALLISKAPEMLVMLKDIFENEYVNGYTYYKLEQLIKQATELSYD